MNRIFQKKRKPPIVSRWLLNRIMSPYVEYPALGDMEEEFDFICEEDGVKQAKRWYRKHAWKSIPRFAIQLILWSVAMFINYLKVTYRNLLKHKSYSFLNISGLALGIACCIIILVYVADELSYDTYHEKADNIYRIIFEGDMGSNFVEYSTNSSLLAPDLVAEYPEVKNSVRLKRAGKTVFSYEDKKSYETSWLYADGSFFDIFSMRLVKGDTKAALTLANTVVLTETAAKKYFADEDPMGKTLTLNNTLDLTVTGVMIDVPHNTHFSFNLLVSMETYETRSPNEFANNVANRLTPSFYTYIVLQDGTDHRDIDAKLVHYTEKTVGAVAKQFGATIRNYLQPVTSIHLHSDLDNELQGNSDISYVYAFSLIAFFILLIACINFMNLSTARSASRAKEVGVRKVLGAFKKQLTKQFLSESVVFSLISLVTALILVQVTLPFFSALSGKNLQINYFEMPWLVAGVIGIVLFIGFVAGSYPALFLASFRPVSVLKGDLSQGARNARFRSVLVVLQFTISIGLVIGTSVIYDQLEFMKNKRLGFDKEQLLVLSINDPSYVSQVESIKNEMATLNGVTNAALSNIALSIEKITDGFFPEGKGRAQAVPYEVLSVDTEYLDTYGIEIAEGRNFSRETPTDEQAAILINETAVKRLGWRNPIGKTFEKVTDLSTNQFRTFTVIGVVKDLHTMSLYQAIEPLVIRNANNTNAEIHMDNITLKLQSNNIPETMSLIQEKWSELVPTQPFAYTFLDESFDGKYRAEEKLGAVFNTFTGLAIVIGCLGLFGLVSFTAERKTKEIGIRKILGSRVSTIVYLLFKEFSILIILANIVAWPVAYYAMDSWLSAFPYRTSIEITSFFLAGLLTLLVAFFTVSYQTLKAAYMNPVKALRYE